MGHELARNFRYAFRRLLRKPGFTILTALIFAIGIGATSAIFTFVDALLLRPVPFPALDHLAVLWTVDPQAGDHNETTVADFIDWKNQAHSFDSLAAYKYWSANLTGTGDPERIIGSKVSGRFFETLRARFVLGSAFTGTDDVQAEKVAVISDTLWRRDFGSRSDIIGQSIELDNQKYVISGVLEAGFEWPTPSEVWIPLVLGAAERGDRTNRSLLVIARLNRSSGMAQAQAEMSTVATRLAQQFPATNAGIGVRLVRLPGQYSAEITKAFLLFLVGTVTFVLLIACANVSSLLLADAMENRREIAIRAALGASRWRIVSQMLTQSTVLSAIGAALGMAIAAVGIHLIRTSIPADQLRYIPGWREMQLSGRVLGFTGVMAIAAALISGLPALSQVSRPDVNSVLKEGSWGSSAGPGALKLRNLLVFAQFALAAILLLGTALMTKGVGRIIETGKKGFQSDHVLTMRLQLPDFEHQNPRSITNYYREVLASMTGAGDVKSAGAISLLPFVGDAPPERFQIEDQPASSKVEAPQAALLVTSSDYFSALRVPVLRGRPLREDDGLNTQPVAVISEVTARKFWPGRDPLGTKIMFDSGAMPRTWITIVGIVGDVKQFMLDRAYQPTVYVSFQQVSHPLILSIAVRTAIDPIAAFPTIRRKIKNLDASVSVYQVRSMDQLIEQMMAGIRITNSLIGICGLIAIVLASAGLYGTIVATVVLKTQEIGLRMAFGASTRSVIALFVSRALKLATYGLFLGVPIALVAGRLLSSFLYQVVTVDLYAVIGVCVLIGVIAFAAAYFPARRAASVTPMAALRQF